MSCPHTRITPGLDAICCKDCGKWWQSWQPEYDRLLNQQTIDSEPAQNTQLPTVNCQHHWIVTWSSDCRLINYCDRCHCTQPVSDPSVLERERSLVRLVKAEYEQALLKSKKPGRKREFELAIADKKQQLQYLDEQLGAQAQTPDPKLDHSHFRVGDRVFHAKWKRHGIIRAPITPNWVVRFSNGDFVVAGHELHPRETETVSTDPEDPEDAVLTVEPELETVSTDPGDPEDAVLTVEPELETVSTDSEDPEDAVLTVEPELETVSTDSEDPEDAVLTVEPDPITRRKRGDGTGRIQWRTTTKKNGKEYKQAWYDWQIHQGGKSIYKSAYIPKRLIAKIQELELEKAPVREILKLLGREND